MGDQFGFGCSFVGPGPFWPNYANMQSIFGGLLGSIRSFCSLKDGQFDPNNGLICFHINFSIFNFSIWDPSKVHLDHRKLDLCPNSDVSRDPLIDQID